MPSTLSASAAFRARRTADSREVPRRLRISSPAPASVPATSVPPSKSHELLLQGLFPPLQFFDVFPEVFPRFLIIRQRQKILENLAQRVASAVCGGRRRGKWRPGAPRRRPNTRLRRGITHPRDHADEPSLRIADLRYAPCLLEHRQHDVVGN